MLVVCISMKGGWYGDFEKPVVFSFDMGEDLVFVTQYNGI